MKRRLIRVLQRGGVTAWRREDVWAVWRTPDRRRREVGTVSGAEIDLLRLYDGLVPIEEANPSVLRWGAQTWPATLNIGAVTDCARSAVLFARPLLHHLVLDWRPATERYQVTNVARAFRRDALDKAGAGAACEACDRLARIVETYSDQDCRFLHALLIKTATKTDLSKQFDLRPAAIEAKAVRALRDLVDIYAGQMAI